MCECASTSRDVRRVDSPAQAHGGSYVQSGCAHGKRHDEWNYARCVFCTTARCQREGGVRMRARAARLVMAHRCTMTRQHRAKAKLAVPGRVSRAAHSDGCRKMQLTWGCSRYICTVNKIKALHHWIWGAASSRLPQSFEFLGYPFSHHPCLFTLISPK